MVTDQIYFLNKQEKPAKDTEKKRSERQKEKLEGMISQMSKYQSNTFYIIEMTHCYLSSKEIEFMYSHLHTA